MAARIGLISDIHASPGPLQEALAIFRQEKVDMVLCAGDIAGYGTAPERVVELLIQGNCTTIRGNHDAWYLDSPAGNENGPVATYLSQLPERWESVMAGKYLYAVHASPLRSLNRGIRLLDENGAILPAEKARWAAELDEYQFNVLVVGHTHQVFTEQVGKTLVINPGSTKFNHTCAILSLPDLGVRIFPLSGKEPLKSWNWGMMTGGRFKL